MQTVPYLSSIYTAHVQSVHHLSYPCPFSTPSLLLIPSQYTVSTAHVYSKQHNKTYLLQISNPSCWCPVSAPYHLPRSSLYKNLSVHVQTVHHVFALVSRWNGERTLYGQFRLCIAWALAGEIVLCLAMDSRDSVLVGTWAWQLVYWFDMGRKYGVLHWQGNRDRGHEHEEWGTEYWQMWWYTNWTWKIEMVYTLDWDTNDGILIGLGQERCVLIGDGYEKWCTN